MPGQCWRREHPRAGDAPTNSAFAALPRGTLKSLLKPAAKGELASILTYHVVPGALKSSQIQPGAV